MDIIITGRNLELDEPFKKYVNKKLNKLTRLYDRVYKCDVIVEEEKTRKNIEIIVHLKRNRLVAKESSQDVYVSIDNAVGKIKTQLRRLNGRVVSKRRGKGILDKMVARMRNMDESVKISKKGKIIQENSFADKPMHPEEAKLELDLSGKDFIMFRNANTGEANVLYKKSNGNHGLIEPNF
ncbi:MAG: ribosome-associated translation inhibitor RaiA [Candidatus Omnitrophota bacterium]|nr:ribosome-associated translation inhibitor RaiA [Candidatus Omnitrophota bacterium]MBU1895135.1 ribosome-associated translation inhibitor RaiA [Candidatus Omnitrophota bacterium]